MENKETEKIVSKIQFYFFYHLFNINLFFYGYYDENSAGAGGYGGDFQSIWNNLKNF